MNWKSVLLSPDDPVAEAIKVLDRDDSRIVLVVEEDNKLVGTITDGDIRRGLLKGCSLDALLSDVMNPDPKVGSVGDDRKVTERRMVNLSVRQMPIVDADRVVRGLKTLQQLNERKTFKNPVFIMAGGFGTRLLPLTNDVPKPMLKIGGKPILERILEGFIKSGFSEFYISTHYKAEIVKNYFGTGERWGVDIHYVFEDVPLGTGGALGLLPDSITKLPIIMMNGDILTNIDYRKLIEFHDDLKGIATVCVKEYDIQVPYGVVEGEKHQVKKIVEKPVRRFFVNAGIYVLNPILLDGKDGSSYLDMPSFLEELIEQGKKVSMFPIHEYWLDIGQMDEFERAQKEVHLVLEDG